MSLLNVSISAEEKINISLSLSWCQNTNKMAKTYTQSPLSKIQHNLPTSASHPFPGQPRKSSSTAQAKRHQTSRPLLSSWAVRSSQHCSIRCRGATTESRLILTSNSPLCPIMTQVVLQRGKPRQKKSTLCSYPAPPTTGDDPCSSHTSDVCSGFQCMLRGI